MTETIEKIERMTAQKVGRFQEELEQRSKVVQRALEQILRTGSNAMDFLTALKEKGIFETYFSLEEDMLKEGLRDITIYQHFISEGSSQYDFPFTISLSKDKKILFSRTRGYERGYEFDEDGVVNEESFYLGSHITQIGGQSIFEERALDITQKSLEYSLSKKKMNRILARRNGYNSIPPGI